MKLSIFFLVLILITFLLFFGCTNKYYYDSNFNFDTNQNNEDLNNPSNDLMTCSSLGGIICNQGEECSTYTLPADDSEFCCIQGQCIGEETTCGNGICEEGEGIFNCLADCEKDANQIPINNTAPPSQPPTEIPTFTPEGSPADGMFIYSTGKFSENNKIYVWSEIFKGITGQRKIPLHSVYSTASNWIYNYSNNTWLYSESFSDLFKIEGTYYVKENQWYFYGNGWAEVTNLNAYTLQNCSNSICESDLGENKEICPKDCGSDTLNCNQISGTTCTQNQTCTTYTVTTKDTTTCCVEGICEDEQVYSEEITFQSCPLGTLCASGQIVKNPNSGWMEYINNYFNFEVGAFNPTMFDLFPYEDYQNVPVFAVSWRDIEPTNINSSNETQWKNQIKNSALGKAIDKYFYNPPNGKKPRQILLHVNVNFDLGQQRVNWRGEQLESGAPQWFVDKLSQEDYFVLTPEIVGVNKYVEIPFYSDEYKKYIDRLYYRISKTYGCDIGKAGDCPIFAIRHSGTGYFGEEIYVEDLHSLLASNATLKEKFKNNKLAFADKLKTYFPKQDILFTPYQAECVKYPYSSGTYGPKNESEYEAYLYSNAFNELVNKGWSFERDSTGNIGGWNPIAGLTEYLKSDISYDFYDGPMNPSTESCWKDYSTVPYFKNNNTNQEILKGPVVIETGGQHYVFAYGMTPADQTITYMAAGDVQFQIDMAQVRDPFSEQTFWLKQGLTWHPNIIQGPSDVMFNYPFWAWVNGWVDPSDNTWWNAERRARIDNSKLIEFFPTVANKLGAHLFLDSFDYTLGTSTLNYTAKWKNKGVGQVFDGYELVFNVRNSNNEIVYTGIDASFDIKNIPPGTYKVKLNNNQGGFVDSTYIHTGNAQLHKTQAQETSEMKLTIELKYKEAGVVDESFAIENLVPYNNDLENREYLIKGNAQTELGCTAFTYSDWAPTTCPQSEVQTRTIENALPNGCTGGNPILTQSCTYVPPCTRGTWTNTSTYRCTGGIRERQQTRTVNPTNCDTTTQWITSACPTNQICTGGGICIAPTCTSFTYNAWTPVICPESEVQTRTIKTSSPTDCTGGNPILTKTCTYIPPEICDGIDNDGDGQTDEGCDDDFDDYADASMQCPQGEEFIVYKYSENYKTTCPTNNWCLMGSENWWSWGNGWIGLNDEVWFHYENGWISRNLSCSTNSGDIDDTNPNVH